MDFSIAIVPGDGIGPEVISEGRKTLDAIGRAFGHKFNQIEASMGGNAIDQYGVPLPPRTLEICRHSDAILLGAVGGPKWDDPAATVRPEDGLLMLRKELRLFANLRPVKVHPDLIDASPLKPSLLEGVDVMVVRELTGGLYFAKPKRRWETQRGRRGVDTLRYTEEEVRRILEVGFNLSSSRRCKLTSVDKANVLETSRMWRQIATEMADQYPQVTLEHMLVDNVAMQLIRDPSRFDVIVTENTFGDILTDEASVLSGSMGMLPSASLSAQKSTRTRKSQSIMGLYEPIHGSAPDIAGKGIANPIATILSVALMLRLSFRLEEEANAVESAVATVLSSGLRTADIAPNGGNAIPTSKMGDEIAQTISS